MFKALPPILTPASSTRRFTISSSVTFVVPSIISAMKASCGSRAEPRRQPYDRGACSPVFAHPTQRIAVEMPIPNRPAD